MLRENVTLTVSTRPLRLIFVVQSREDVSRAVSLFTHVWGGSSNIILPVTSTDEDAVFFEQTLRRFDPDVILYSMTEVPEREERILQNFPCQKVVVTDEAISNHNEGEMFLPIQSANLSHSGIVLDSVYPSGLQEKESRIHLLDSDDINSCLNLMYGLPTQRYRTYLSKRLGGKRVKVPKTFRELCIIAAIASTFATPLSLSITRLTPTFTLMHPSHTIDYKSLLEGPLTREPKSLYIFLDTENSLTVPCTYWNIRGRSSSHHKLILPYQEFLADIPGAFSILLQAFSVNQIFIVTDSDEEDARNIYSLIMAALSSVNNKSLVAVCYNDFKYALPDTKYTHGLPETSTRLVNDDTSIMFIPRIPIGHAQERWLFGYECDIRASSGKVLSLPTLPLISRLLQNSATFLQMAETTKANFHSGLVVRNYVLRSSSTGVAGSTTPGTECCFFWHTDETWITEILKNVGIRIAPNRHTLYARGFIKKFGGITKTLSLIRGGGQAIIHALCSRRAEQCGFVSDQIKSYVETNSNFDRATAQTLVEQRLPELLAAGLIRRGIALTCPVCNLKAWYPINNLEEFVECAGCAEQFQLDSRRIEFSYIPNELARRFILTGGEALLVTASVLLLIQPSASIQFGGDLHRGREKSNFAEIDLVVLSRDSLILVECKSLSKIDDKELNDIRESTSRAIEAARIIGSTDIVVGIVTKDNPQKIYPVIRELALEGGEKGIDVDLILNGEFFLRGASEPTDVSQVKYFNRHMTLKPKSIGEIKTSFGIGGDIPAGNTDILEKWSEDMRIVDSTENTTSS